MWQAISGSLSSGWMYVRATTAAAARTTFPHPGCSGFSGTWRTAPAGGWPKPLQRQLSGSGSASCSSGSEELQKPAEQVDDLLHDPQHNPATLMTDKRNLP